MVQLFHDEELHRLYAEGSMKIIQSPSVFSFSLDAVLLAHFARIPRGKRGKILDLGTGNGVIPLFLSSRTDAQIKGLEVQERLVSMARRSVLYNHLGEQIKIIHGDLRERTDELEQGSFDVVTCNPPYFKRHKEGELNKNPYITVARHEVLCSLEDVIKACKLYVKPGGRVSIVYRPDRLVELISLLNSYRLEPKILRFIYPKKGKDANIVLLEAVRDGKAGIKVLEPLIIYEENNRYTKEAEEIIYARE